MSENVLTSVIGPTFCIEVVGIDRDALSESDMDALEVAVFDVLQERQGRVPREVVVTRCCSRGR